MTRLDAVRILGVAPAAGEKEVQQAYRELVKVWHPDRFREDAALAAKADEKLKEINEAYRILKSSQRADAAPLASPVSPGKSRQTAYSFASEGRWISWLAIVLGILAFGWAWFQLQDKPQPRDTAEDLRNIT